MFHRFNFYKKLLNCSYFLLSFTLLLQLLFGANQSVEIRSGFYKVGSVHSTRMQLVNKPVVYDNGILFTFYGKKNDKVFLSGSFNNWQKKIPLRINDHGIFYYFLTLPLKKGDYTYRFQVNGIWVNDEQQPFFNIDHNKERVSYFRLSKDILFTINQSPEHIGNGVYRFYLEDKGYENVNLISDRNNWNPNYTPLVQENGYWYVDIDLEKKKLLYTYWVDGKKLFDPLNFSRSLTSFNYAVNYVLPVPETESP